MTPDLHKLEFKGPSRPIGENRVQFYDVLFQGEPVVIDIPRAPACYRAEDHSVYLNVTGTQLGNWFHILENYTIGMVPDSRRSCLQSVFRWNIGTFATIRCKIMPDTRVYRTSVPIELHSDLDFTDCTCKIQIQNIQWNVKTYGLTLRVREIHFP